jgi:hypothetical protein
VLGTVDAADVVVSVLETVDDADVVVSVLETVDDADVVVSVLGTVDASDVVVSELETVDTVDVVVSRLETVDATDVDSGRVVVATKMIMFYIQPGLTKSKFFVFELGVIKDFFTRWVCSDFGFIDESTQSCCSCWVLWQKLLQIFQQRSH